MNSSYTNPNDLQREIQPFLHYDETLLWTGKPGKISAQKNPALLLFAIFWMGFAVFWTIAATATGGPLGLFGMLFMFIGGITFYNTFFGKRNLLKQAVYAVTDQRAIIITRGRNGMDCTEYRFSKLHDVNLESVQGNVGTIRFAEELPYEEYGNTLYRRRYINQNTIKRSAVSAFFMIENVHQVHLLISEQLNKT